MLLDDRITKQIGDYKEKRDRISMMEQKIRLSKPNSVSSFNKKYFVTSIAACIAIAIFVMPFIHNRSNILDELNIEQPSLSDFRAASPTAADIDDVMSRKEYADALPKIEAALASSADELAKLEDLFILDEEALLYEKEVAIAHHYQLEWTHIYVLIQLERNSEAIDALQSFVEYKGEHKKEAKLLLDRLKGDLAQQ